MDLVSKIETILSGIKLPNESEYYDSALEMIKEASCVWSLKEIKLPKDINEMKEAAEETVKSYRKQAIKTVIEPYRKDYPLLEKVIQGETTFEKEYKPLIDKYSGIRSFFLPRWLTKEETRIPKENKELIHDYNLSSIDKALSGKPISWAVTGAIMAYATSAIFGLICEPIPHANIATYLATGFGFLLGTGCSEGVYKHKNLLKKDLKLLDEQIREVYPKS